MHGHLSLFWSGPGPHKLRFGPGGRGQRAIFVQNSVVNNLTNVGVPRLPGFCFESGWQCV